MQLELSLPKHPIVCNEHWLITFPHHRIHSSTNKAESKGVEPLYRVTGSLGLANLHITTLSTLQTILRRERESNPRTCYSQLFSRQLPRPTGLSPSCEWLDSNQLNPKATVLQTVTTLQLRRTHICGNRMIRTFIRRLTSDRSAIELCFRSLFLHFTFRWPGETRTLNSRCKRPVLWSNWVTNQFCCDWQIRTVNYYLVTIVFSHWIKSQCCDDWQIRTINLYGISVMFLTNWAKSSLCCGYKIRTCIWSLWDFWVSHYSKPQFYFVGLDPDCYRDSDHWATSQFYFPRMKKESNFQSTP